VAALHRYLNVRKELPPQPASSVNPLTEPPAPPAPLVRKIQGIARLDPSDRLANVENGFLGRNIDMNERHLR